MVPNNGGDGVKLAPEDFDLLAMMISSDEDLLQAAKWGKVLRQRTSSGEITFPVRDLAGFAPLLSSAPLEEDPPVPWLELLVPAAFWPVDSEADFLKKILSLIKLAHRFPPQGVPAPKVR